MISDASAQLIYQMLNAPIREYPFPHFFNTGMFPESIYAEIMKNMPDENDYQALLETGSMKHIKRGMEEIYNQRSVIDLSSDQIKVIDESKRYFWVELRGMLSSPDFVNALLQKFKHWIISQYGEGIHIKYRVSIELVRDSQKYALGPHTHHPSKFAVILFYLPPDDMTSYLGTSMYTPKEAEFRCKGGPHYDLEKFNCAITLPFLPNSAVGFYKNNCSFHGVEPVKKVGDVRNLIQLSVHRVT